MKDLLKLISDVVFSEVDKKNLDKDAPAIATVILNRIANPSRFGITPEQVIFSPNQFSGIGSKEWQKTQNGNMTEKEQNDYKRIVQLVSGTIKGTIVSEAGDSDHYYNPKLSKPSWGKVYPKRYDSGSHFYLKEQPIPSKKPGRPKRVPMQVV